LNTKDIAISKLGQVSIKNSTNYQSIINELLTYTNLTRLEITGGEPFLYNGLERIVEQSTSTVNIVTGLGVDTKRLERLLLLLPKDRVTLSISAENLNQLYEFNRYGNTYSKFLTNIEVIQNSGIGYQFYSTLSNLTIFGLGDFISKFKDNKIHLNTCADPMYLSANVLDKNSKQLVKDTDYGQFNAVIHSMIEQQFDNSLHNQLKQFIVEFAQRRNLNFNIFPDSFKNWLTI
jgi:MoaA/NifB/PqqE/SkfB family radical SAM enzyme